MLPKLVFAGCYSKILRSLRRFVSLREPPHDPTIAILDWKGLPTHSEFLLFQQYFREHNLQALICSPDDLRFHDGRLYALLPSSSAGEDGGDDPSASTGSRRCGTRTAAGRGG